MAGVQTYHTFGGQAAAASATETHLEAQGEALSVSRVDRVRVSQDTHVTSEQYSFAVQRVSVVGTGGAAVVPELKNAGAAAGGIYTDGRTAEPTYTGVEFINFSWNSLTGRDMPFTDGTEVFLAPAIDYGLKTVNPSGTTTYTPKAELDFAEIG